MTKTKICSQNMQSKNTTTCCHNRRKSFLCSIVLTLTALVVLHMLPVLQRLVDAYGFQLHRCFYCCCFIEFPTLNVSTALSTGTNRQYKIKRTRSKAYLWLKLSFTLLYSIIICVKVAELHTSALTDIVLNNIY